MLKENQRGDFISLCLSLGYKFKNNQLLLQAMTRKSVILEGVQNVSVKGHQRLAFLGHQVIEMAVSKYLYEQHPDWEQRKLKNVSDNLVNNRLLLIRVAKVLELKKYIIMDEEERGLVDSNLFEYVEAIFGAIFLDSDEDFKIVKKLVIEHCKLMSQPHCEKPPSHLVAAILEKYIPIFRIYTKNDNEYTQEYLNNALLLIIEKSADAEDLRILLEAGANPNSTKVLYQNNQRVVSALQLAKMQQKPSSAIIQLLLEFGADPNWNKTTLKLDSFQSEAALDHATTLSAKAESCEQLEPCM